MSGPVILEYWVRGFEPHERAERYRCVRDDADTAKQSLMDIDANPTIALIRWKIYQTVEVESS